MTTTREQRIEALLIEQNNLLRSIARSIADRLSDRDEEKEYLTIDEVAKRLRRHPGTVRRWIAQRRLPARKLNGGVRQDRYLVHRDEVRKLLQLQKGGRRIERRKLSD